MRADPRASTVLSTVAGSTITVAGVMFSVTIVALTLAANQFGSAVVANVMRDKGIQFSLGTLVSTFVYCVVVLRSVRRGNGEEFTPHRATTLGVILGLASVIVVIFFIHHVARLMQASSFTESSAEELREAIESAFPQNQHNQPVTHAEERAMEEQPVRSQGTGYVLAIDEDILVRVASEADLMVRVLVMPGDFIVESDVLAAVVEGRPLDEHLHKKIRDAFSLCKVRATIQDVRFAFDKLIQMAARALSPALNDPYTASLCLDRLGEGLGIIAQRPCPPDSLRDERGVVRVRIHRVGFVDLASRVLTALYSSAKESDIVLLYWLAMLEKVALVAKRPEQRGELLRQVGLLSRAAVERESQKGVGEATRISLETMTILKPGNPDNDRHGPGSPE